MIGSNAVGHNRKDGTVGGATVVDTRADSVDDIVRGAKELSGTVSEFGRFVGGDAQLGRVDVGGDAQLGRVDVGGGPRLVGGFLGCACRVAGVLVVLYGVGIGFGLARAPCRPRSVLGVGFGFALLTGVRLGMCIIVGFGIGTHFGFGLGLIF